MKDTAHTIRSAKQVTRNKKRVFPVTSHMSRVTIKGFTLVELLVVIAIVGLLLAAGIAVLNPVTQINRGNDARRKADLARVQVALELYRSDNGNYPSTVVGLSGLTDGSPQYMPELPTDPKTGLATNYLHYLALPSSPACDNANTVCNGYQIYACLENLSDPALDTTVDNSGSDKCVSSGVISYTVTNQ